MTYYGVILLLAGYQADEAHILKQYRAMIDRYALSVFCTGSNYVIYLEYLVKCRTKIPHRFALDTEQGKR